MIQIEQLNVPALLEENTYLKKQVAYYQETTEQLQKEYTYLRGKIEEIEQEQEEIIADQVSRECAHLRNKVEQLDTRLTWRSNVDRISGDVLTPSRKATIIRLRTYLKEHAACADTEGYQQVLLENLAGEQGIGALGDNINYVSIVHPQDKSGQYRLDIPAVIPLFEKRLIWVQDGPKEWHQEAFIKALPLLEDPPLWAYACTSIIQHGGLRPGAGRPKKCERCGHDLEEKNTVTRKQRSTHCPKCGIDHVYPEEIVSEPLTPTDPLPPDGGGLKNQVDFSISEGEEPSENQLDLDYLDTRGQVDFSTSQEETSENQLDFSIQDGDPVTPPPGLAIGEYPTNGFSLEELLNRRIGHGEIIHATGRLDKRSKYLPIRVNNVTFDLAAYLRGDLQHIYGSRPALPDGATWLLGFDCDTPELDAQRLEWQEQLAAAGIPSIYWKRRPGRGHLEVYVDTAVNRKAFYAHLLSVCPGLAAIPECFPIGSDQNTGGDDRADFPYSWPLWYRVGDAVIECEASVWCAGDPHPMGSPGIESDKNRLTWLISLAMTPASLIPELPAQEEDVMPDRGVALLDIPPGRPVCPFDDGLGKAVIAAFNRQPWETIVEVVDGWFRASWRKERTPSVKINADGTAHDFGRTGNYSKHFDKFEAYCLINQLDKSEELKWRIAEYKALGESIAS